MSDQRGPEAPRPPDDAPPTRADAPAPLWYTPQPPPPSTPAELPPPPPAAGPPYPPPPPGAVPLPPARQPAGPNRGWYPSAEAVRAARVPQSAHAAPPSRGAPPAARPGRGVGTSFVALMVCAVVAAGAVAAAVIGGASGDDQPASSPGAAATERESAGGSSSNCAVAEIIAPFESLPRDMPSAPASEANWHRAEDRFSGSGTIELRDVRYGDESLIAGIAAGVDDPQRFIDDFLSRHASYSGAPPRSISIDGKQAALVTVDLAPTYGTALVTFMECRVVIVLGRDDNTLMTVAGALTAGG